MKRKIDFKTFQDKILGGWIGKSAGGIMGAPIEGFKRFNNIELSEKLFETNYPNDDLDLQVLWLDLAKRKGPLMRSSDFGDYWKNHVDFPWNEYGIATRNLKLGVYPPLSGAHNNWYWKESMGCPIRSEIWGMLCPGMPEQASFYAKMDASIDHEDFSVDAEMFLSACEAEAFFESDIETIFKTVLPIINPDGTFYKMAVHVIELYHTCSYDVAREKIKGMWGDADFTSAPQNLAFTLLALLSSKSKFDTIMDALHLGHDSDCIAATVGAMLGIINGASNISEQWKKMVGNDLIVSPEIMNIEYANSLSELAEDTAKAAIPFINFYKQIEMSQAPSINEDLSANPINIEIINNAYQSNQLDTKQAVTLNIESVLEDNKEVRIEFSSDILEFENKTIELKLNGKEEIQTNNTLWIKEDVFSSFKNKQFINVPSSFLFTIKVSVNGKEAFSIDRGIPYYGAWLLAGPFIEDAPELEPMDEKYPDHGIASMPGVNYMNHDKLNKEKEFVTCQDLRELVDKRNFNEVSYLTQVIYPECFKINLNKYFYGKGEKSLYLYSKVNSPKVTKKWIAIGCTAYFKVWVNGNLIHQQDTLSRSWPADKAIECNLQKGINDVMIRIDMPLDKAEIEIGFKEFVSKHAHQSQWDITLVPFV